MNITPQQYAEWLHDLNRSQKRQMHSILSAWTGIVPGVTIIAERYR